MKTIYDVPIILRREIEALMVKPFIDAFEKELGHEKTYSGRWFPSQANLPGSGHQ